MAKNGLDKWFAQKWVDIGSKKKDGSFSKCGRSKQKKDAKRKYPKCVPLAKARMMAKKGTPDPKKKKPAKPSARLEALRGKKFFKRGGKA